MKNIKEIIEKALQQLPSPGESKSAELRIITAITDFPEGSRRAVNTIVYITFRKAETDGVTAWEPSDVEIKEDIPGRTPEMTMK